VSVRYELLHKLKKQYNQPSFTLQPNILELFIVKKQKKRPLKRVSRFNSHRGGANFIRVFPSLFKRFQLYLETTTSEIELTVWG
jgi:hypothetical protein